MAQPEVAAGEPEAPPVGYRMARGLLRLWFALFFGKVRVLGAERMPATGPALLAVSHPPSFLDALILVAAVERYLVCLVPQHLLRKSRWRLIAGGLRMVPYEPEGVAWVETACARLAQGESVVLFAEPARDLPAQAGLPEQARRGGQAGRASPASQPAQACATLALEAEARRKGQPELVILPVHLFLPVSRSLFGELVIHIDRTITTKDYLQSQERARALADIVEGAWRENAFRLGSAELDVFLCDLERLLQADLQDDWASRPDWGQKVEGFRLSGLVRDWSQETNYLNPGRLVVLREALEDCRERARRWSLGKFKTELAEWMGSGMRRGWVWVESALGWPIALYGLINHLLAWCVLSWSGLVKREDGRDPRLGWALRLSVLLGCYALQVLACAYFLGRPAAGYYAPTLPLTGAYAWRYGWLLRHRTYPAIVSLLLPRRLERLRQRRKEFIEQLNLALSAYAEVRGIPH